MSFLFGVFLFFTGFWAIALLLAVINAVMLVSREDPEKYGQEEYDEV